jgi:hypothetical protein
MIEWSSGEIRNRKAADPSCLLACRGYTSGCHLSYTPRVKRRHASLRKLQEALFELVRTVCDEVTDTITSQITTVTEWMTDTGDETNGSGREVLIHVAIHAGMLRFIRSR